MLQKIGQVISKGSECDLQFRFGLVHSEQALNAEAPEEVTVHPHLIVLDLERTEPRSIGCILIALRRHDATLGIGDIGFKHEHAIQFSIVICVDVVLVALLEVLLHHLADGRFVKNNVVLAISGLLS